MYSSGEKMKIFIITGCLIWSLIACGETKKKDPDKTEKAAESAQPQNEVPVSEDKPSSLEELVYDATGASRLRTESAARSSAELNGRNALIETLAEDAVSLLDKFYSENKAMFASSTDLEKYKSEIKAGFKKSTTLKGSTVAEYTQSTKGDTTYAVVEIPLMGGYDAIEEQIVAAGEKNNFLKSEHMTHFKTAFKEFFLNEKKKILTIPA